MSGAHTDLLSLLESLGDNCELGFYLRQQGNEKGSFLRWVLCPINAVIDFVERDAPRDGFAFENLVSNSPGMVRDQRTGLSFHSAMRSEAVGDGFKFLHDEATRRELYVPEKAKHDHLLKKFEQALSNEEPRIFIVKANEAIKSENIHRLHQAIAANKRTENFVLVAVFADAADEPHTTLQWQNDSLCFAYVDRFAHYLAANDIHTASWRRVCDELAESPRISAWLATKSVSLANNDSFRSKPWQLHSNDIEKFQYACEMAQSLETRRDFADLISFFETHDTVFAAHIGADLYRALLLSENSVSGKIPLRSGFLESYERLIQCMANFDLTYAFEFHAAAKTAHTEQALLLKKHQHLSTILQETNDTLTAYGEQNLELHSVTPKVDTLLQHRSLPVQRFSSYCSEFMRSKQKASCIELVLPEPRMRVIKSCATATEDSAAQWGNNVRSDAVGSFKVFLLPNARLSPAPCALSFEEDGAHRFVQSVSLDAYCHTMAGITAFCESTKSLPLAYVLPQHTDNSFYQSVVHRLPALYGYVRLGLECPIVSMFELTDSERQLVKRLGIDPNSFIYDKNGEYRLQTAIVPQKDGLAPLFYKTLGQLPKVGSPVGKRVYVARSRNAASRLDNEAEIQARMRELGFAVVDFDQCSLDDRIAIASNAEWIVATHGQELTHMVFSEAANVIELIPNEHAMPIFKQLSIDCGHRYSVVVGQTATGYERPVGPPNWRADVDALSDIVDRAAA